MIVKMLKIYIVARNQDRDRLLECVRDLGVIHLKPVDPARAVADEKTIAEIKSIERAIQIISSITPASGVPTISPVEAAQEILDIQRHSNERHGRLSALHRQIEQLRIWGEVELKQFDELREAGIDVRFFSIPSDQVSEIQAECVEVISTFPGKRSMVAVIDRSGQPKLPEQSTEVHLPQRDIPSIRAEAREIDAALKQDAKRLANLANLTCVMETRLAELKQQAEYTIASRGAEDNEFLFAIQGWMPSEIGEIISSELSDEGIEAAVETFDPKPDEDPPTLIQYPVWAKPIEGLFKLLGTVAGYREFDVSAVFMIALPIFAAMLISDGGYGAVLCMVPLLFYGKVSGTLGVQFTRLLIVVGASALIWGFLCGSFFGFVIYTPPIPVNITGKSRLLLMHISFVIGAVHLSLAQCWQAVRFYPDLRFLNRVGWALFIWGMLGVVQMFVLKTAMDWNTPWPYLLFAGGTLAILFASPSWNIFKMLGLGIADFPLSMLSAFSDIISYVRLMAVGLASSVLAASFNNLAMGMDSWLATAGIMVFGHGLNLALAMIALFAHGVRLNMLEFSSNLGIQWTGYPYRAFTKQTI